MEHDKEDESDDYQMGSDLDPPKAQIVDKEEVKAMTDEEKELADLFLESLGALPSVD
jgi:hypothetical protein